MNYQPIATAPVDGTTIRAICGKNLIGAHLYEFSARFLEGRWCAGFGGVWRPIDPAPSFWRPATSASQQNQSQQRLTDE